MKMISSGKQWRGALHGQHSFIALQMQPDGSLESPVIPAPNQEDMQRLAFILANMTDHLDSAPEIALTIASQEMGWLYSKDVPK